MDSGPQGANQLHIFQNVPNFIGETLTVHCHINHEGIRPLLDVVDLSSGLILHVHLGCTHIGINKKGRLSFGCEDWQTQIYKLLAQILYLIRSSTRLPSGTEEKVSMFDGWSIASPPATASIGAAPVAVAAAPTVAVTPGLTAVEAAAMSVMTSPIACMCCCICSICSCKAAVVMVGRSTWSGLQAVAPSGSSRMGTSATVATSAGRPRTVLHLLSP